MSLPATPFTATPIPLLRTLLSQYHLHYPEIAKPRVRKPRAFIKLKFKIATRTFPETPPSSPPKTCPCRSPHSTIHSYTFPYKEGRVFRDLEEGFWGREEGAAIYENLGFPVLNPGFRKLRIAISGHLPRGTCDRKKSILIENSQIQGAAKGGRQKEFDHFFRFRDSFGYFWSLFVTFLPKSFCGRVTNPGLKFSIAIGILYLDRIFSAAVLLFAQGPPGVQKRARSRITIHDRSLEVLSPKAAIEIFQDLETA